MRTLFLVAAIAAVAFPTAASAEHHERHHEGRHHHDFGRHHYRKYDRHYYRHGYDRHHHVRYVSPYRHWSHHRVRPGYRLRPAFYGSRYYINDYDMYGVRAPSRYERWVRYGDELLLVNVRTGRVLAVRPYW